MRRARGEWTGLQALRASDRTPRIGRVPRNSRFDSEGPPLVPMDRVFDVRGDFGNTLVCRGVTSAGIDQERESGPLGHAVSLAPVVHEHQSSGVLE